MAFASGSMHGVGYVAESVFGATPSITPGDLKMLRITGSSLNLAKDSVTSGEIRDDRMITELRHGVKRIQGNLDFEFSYGVLDDLMAGAAFAAWDSDVLDFGSGSPASFTLERRFADIGRFQRFTGCMASEFSLTLAPERIVTGSLAFLGKGMATASSSLDAAPTAAPAHAPFDAFSGTITEGGAPIATVTGLDLAVKNGLEPAFVIGAEETPAITAGRLNVTGRLEAFFEDLSLLDKFVSETESSLAFTLTDGTRSYAFSLPRIKYTGGDTPVNGEGPVTIAMPFQALYDSVTGSTLTVTRDSGA